MNCELLVGNEDEDDDDEEPMMLEPQTEMTVEGEDDEGDDDDDEDGGSTGDEIALPPSVTLRPAGAPQLLTVRLNMNMRVR